MTSTTKLLLPTVFAALLFSSCATTSSYYNNLNKMIGEKRYPEAAGLIESEKFNSYGEKNALLYYLDLGYLQHLAGQYDESNASFERAKKISDDHFTQSVTTELLTFLVSDNSRPYYGEDFERALINIFSALNYAFLGKDRDALVEARQVDQFLTKLQTDTGSKSVYKEDAFARYLMGMLQENMGDFNDAYISYYQSLRAYKEGFKYFKCAPPTELIADTLRLAGRLGMDDDIAGIKKDFVVTPYSVPAGYGELVLLSYNGCAPEKVDFFIDLAFGKAWANVGLMKPKGEDAQKTAMAAGLAKSVVATDMIRIAFPKYEDIPYETASVETQVVGSDNVAFGQLADDVGSIAKTNLDDHINRVRVKAIARAAVKHVLAKQAADLAEQAWGKFAGKLAKKAAQAVATGSESSDKRSWRSLPDKIMVVRMPLAAGTHSVKIVFRSKSGAVVGEQTMENVKITAKKKTFAAVRSAK
jgi:hypothetical protein